MLDCFVATLDLTPGRIALSKQVLSGLSMQEGLKLTLLDAGSDPEQLKWFHKEGFNVIQHPREGSTHRRFLLPEILALSEYYLLLDDDCIPITQYWLAKSLAMARRHPQFGLLGLGRESGDYSYINGTFYDNEVRTVQTVGGAMLVKRDVRTAPFEIPLYVDHKNSRGNDADYCKAIRDSGSAVGQLMKVRFKHLDTTGNETTYVRGIVKGIFG